MGLEDLASDVEEEVNALDEEEIEDFIDRFNTISNIVVKLDKRMEDIEQDMDNLEVLLEVLIDEYERLDDTDRGFLDEQIDGQEEEDQDEYSWRS